MGKGRWLAVLAGVLLLSGAGPRGREMEELRLVTALALDGGEEIRATAVTGVRASEDEEPELLTGAGETMAQACAALRESSARRAYLGQTEQLLLGEGMDPLQAMELVARHRELRLDTLLYIVRGNAGEGLAGSAGRMAAETGGQDFRGRTVGEILPRLAEGEYALAPALKPGEDGGLVPGGWAVLGREGVAGWLEEDAAVGAQLLLGLETGKTITIEGGTVELTGVTLRIQGEKLRCRLEGRVLQGTPSAEALGAWGEEKLAAALAEGKDCWGLDRLGAALEPWQWEARRGLDVSKLRIEGKGRLREG